MGGQRQARATLKRLLSAVKSSQSNRPWTIGDHLASAALEKKAQFELFPRTV